MVTRNRSELFTDLQFGRCVVQALMESEQSAETLAYVLMLDHLHWLLHLRDAYSLSQTVRFMKSRSTRLINQCRQGEDKDWSRGFHDKAVRHESQVIDFARYIVANPLRARLVRTVREYSLWDAVWV
ncbi:transposase [Marinobacterium sp. CAU 1594]|nr:transposase [Marinobacterium arenosum]